ncbi:MAG: RNA methyltransferase, partial [Bacteroidales bacterium]|nr:RNA methyltransferase [Bacteroidales bacterium]
FSGGTGIDSLPRDNQFTLLVGPEGDFTEEEVKLSMTAGYTPFHLGESRLRTETAGIFICAAISLRSSP